MIRNFKGLLGAAMALAALGVFGVSVAQAHTPAQFHCHVEPCEATLEADGTGTTAHHVLIIKNHLAESLSFTCNTLSGEATSNTKTATTAEFKNLVYSTCKVVGVEPVNVRMNGCKYNFTATGTVTVTGCEAGKKIEIEIISTKCLFTVGEQGPLNGITFANLGTTGQSPASTRVTAQAKVPGIAVAFHEPVPGACLIKVTQPLTAEYTTGNTIATGYKDGSLHSNTANKVDIWWKATVA